MYHTKEELFQNIKNPLTSRRNIQRIVRCFSLSNKQNFSRVLNLEDFDEKRHDDILYKNMVHYSIFLFHTWRKSIEKLEEEEFLDLKRRDILQDDFKELQDYLRTIPKWEKLKDIENDLHPSDSKLRTIIHKYLFNFDDKRSWNSISSTRLEQDYPESPISFEHFLALHVSYFDVPKLCHLFMKKCQEKSLPYSYKFSTRDNVVNNFVIYADENHLLDYVNILEELKEKFPNLFSRMGRPLPTNGIIDGYIGYGKNKKDDIDDFNEIRAKHLNSACEEFYFDFLSHYYLSEMHGTKQSISLIEYLSDVISITYINTLKSMYKDEEQLYKELGIVFEDLDALDFFMEISEKVKKQLVKQLKENNRFEFKDIKFYFYLGMIKKRKHVISKESITRIIRNSATEVFKNFPQLDTKLSHYIKDTAPIYGISKEYYLDLDTPNHTNSYVKKKKNPS